jgi:hypothetical protein
MRRKWIMLIWFVALPLSAIAQDRPVLSPDDSGATADGGDGTGDVAPRKDPAKSGTVMTAEQGEELEKKIDKLLEEQKKVIEKLDQLQKDLDFVKVSVRVR